MVHQDVICAKSRLFNRRRGLVQPWVQLSQFEPDVFHSYLHWAYTSEIDTRTMQNEANASPDETPMLLSLTKLWPLADYLQDTELCNRLTDMLIDGVHQRTVKSLRVPWNSADFVAAVDHAFEKTPDRSELRTLFTDILIVGITGQQRAAQAHLERALPSLSRMVLLEYSRQRILGQTDLDVRKKKSLRYLRKAKYHNAH